jgi:hypothetical protein
VRQCRPQYSRDAVQCVTRAQTPADLDRCFGVKPEDKKPAEPAPSPATK